MSVNLQRRCSASPNAVGGDAGPEVRDRQEWVKEWLEGRPVPMPNSYSIDRPIYAVTGDVDWASEPCIEDMIGTLTSFDVKPTLFLTHRSEAIAQHLALGKIEVGVHPNFLPGSSHGTDISSVIDHVLSIAPGSKCFRSHCFMDGTPIMLAMRQRGILYDSNSCEFLQSPLNPVQHWSGVLRFPVFWEDDINWRVGRGWDFNDLKASFDRPGLKIINVHPFNFALNIATQAEYDDLKHHAPNLTRDVMLELRNKGSGTRSFVLDFLTYVRDRGERFIPLSQLFMTVASQARTI